MPTKNCKDIQTVYSTEHGRMCPDCGKPMSLCTCRKQKSLSLPDGIVRVGRETKGRKGKGVTTIRGLPLADDKLHDLAKKFKQKCGSGGTIKDGVVEIQGDHRDMISEELTKQGFTVKTANG